MTSTRIVPTTEKRLEDLLKDLQDRVYRLENGGATAGRVSFGDAIVIEEIEISVVVTNPVTGARNVVLRNMLTGATHTITL